MGAHDKYPNLPGKAARDRIAQDKAFDEAFERDTGRDLSKEIGPLLAGLHPAAWPGAHSPASRAERRRVEALLGKDRAERAQEALRVEALTQVESGEYANIEDSVSTPTPEQFADAERRGGGFRRFTPRGERGTVRTVTAYRRKELPQVQRLVLSGVIDGDGFRVCLWYRNLFEQTGLAGNIGSIDYGREVFAPPQSRAMFADWQVEAQDTWRFVRQHIERANLAVLDQVVIEDIPIYRAQRAVGAGWRTARKIFALAVENLRDARLAVDKKI